MTFKADFSNFHTYNKVKTELLMLDTLRFVYNVVIIIVTVKFHRQFSQTDYCSATRTHSNYII